MDEIIASISCRQTYPITILPQWARIVKSAGRYTDYADMIAGFNTITNTAYKYIPENIDYWSDPGEFINNKGGDCEDFAIYKFFSLQLPKYLVVGTLTENNLVHAVCTVYTRKYKDWVALDCMTNDIISWKEYTEGFKPIYLCDMDGVYV